MRMMRRVGPVAWLGSALGTAVLLGITFFVGIFSGGHEIDETCGGLGQVYDQQYRADHWREPGRLFPLHNRCNAHYDLVPAWVNPAVVVLSLLTVGCLVAMVGSAVYRLRSRRGNGGGGSGRRPPGEGLRPLSPG